MQLCLYVCVCIHGNKNINKTIICKTTKMWNRCKFDPKTCKIYMLNSETSYVQAINQAISGETNRRRRKKKLDNDLY